MNNQKNSKIIIILLNTIIVILSILCILFATETIVLKSNNTDNNEINQNIINNNQDYNYYDAESIAKEKMPIAISFINQEKNASVYCGAFNNTNDVILIDDVNYSKIAMESSKKFTTLEQLKEHLNKNLSTELINKYFKNEENSYLEKDGKLYCQRDAKGFDWLVIHDEDKINDNNTIKYIISNKQSNSFDLKIEVEYEIFGSSERKLITINSTITKVDDNWLVSKYTQE